MAICNCDKFPEGSRQKSVCLGTSGLGFHKTNAFRSLHEIEPLTLQEFTERYNASKSTHIKVSPTLAKERLTTNSATYISGCCGSPVKIVKEYPAQEYAEVSVTAKAISETCQLIVKSFRRYESLLELITSVNKFYPGLEILIADDSLEEAQSYPPIVNTIKEFSNVKWFQMPFDLGLSAGRNLLVKEATKPYILLFDDDFVITKQTKLERLLTVLKHNKEISLVAGLVQNQGSQPKNWVSKFSWIKKPDGNKLHMLEVNSEWELAESVEFKRVDICWNFFAARRDSLLQYPWDDSIKIAGEHIDLFLTRYHGKQVSAYTPEVLVLHKPNKPNNYIKFRDRTEVFYAMMKKKWGLTVLQPLAPRIEYRVKPKPSKHLPGILTQAANFAAATVRHIADGLATLPIIESSLRVGICEGCENFRPEDRRCAHPNCGCYIDEKATWKSETCPLGKWPMNTKPNIVVMGVGHSGTTILTKMIIALGWSNKGLDEEYAEHVAIREVNDAAYSSKLDLNKANKLLNTLESPWVLKDPRFCETLPLWIEPMLKAQPLLVWIVREPNAVEASYAKRGEPALIRGFTRPQNLAHAAESFAAWPYPKIKVEYENIKAAVQLFELQR